MTMTQPHRRSRAEQLSHYLQVIAAEHRSGELLEIRYVIRGGDMARVFVPPRRIDRAARVIRSLAPRTDVYCGVLLRTCRAGGRDAVTSSRLAWVEIDAADAVDRLKRFPKTPSMIVTSGTPGHAHAYFALHAAVAPAQLEHVNRTLAHHLGGDPASVDAARILRPAGTLSHKRRPPAPVELVHHDPTTRYELGELVDGLEPQPQRPASHSGGRRTASRELDELLLAIPATTYVRQLAGLQPSRNGKIHCPFHQDRTPSLQLYEHDWYCYGCGAGGSIYDFAARLWLTGKCRSGRDGWKLRGPDFLQVRRQLAEIFLSEDDRARVRTGRASVTRRWSWQ
jgi:hypothetical protein